MSLRVIKLNLSESESSVVSMANYCIVQVDPIAGPRPGAEREARLGEVREREERGERAARLQRVSGG